MQFLLFPYSAGSLWQSWGQEVSVNVASLVECSFNTAELSQDLFQCLLCFISNGDAYLIGTDGLN